MAKSALDIWASATKLSEYFQGLIDENPIDEKTILNQFSRISEPSKSNNSSIANLARQTRSAAIQKQIARAQKSIRNALLEQTLNVLRQGGLNLVGRIRRDGQSAKVEFIEREYWIDAELVPEDNSAISPSANYDELRIALEDAASPTNSLSNEPQRETMRLRMEAVQACIDNGSVDLPLERRPKRDGGNNLQVRVPIYLQYLSETYDQNFEDLTGYSDKSFERTEIEINKKRRENNKQ